MSTDLVSVVIPCFNAEAYIADTLDSVFAQNNAELEIIVVDDGSTDDSISILNRYRERIRLLTQPNMGVSAARNRGTEIASGYYIQYVDSDDLLAPDTIEKRIALMQESGADVVYTNWRYLDESEDGNYVPGQVVDRRIEDVDEDPEIAVFTAFWAPTSAYLFTRKIVEKIGGWRKNLPVIQDARFTLDAVLAGARFEHLSDVGAFYRRHRETGLSRQSFLAFEKDVLTNALEIEAWWKKQEYFNDKHKKALLRVFEYVSRPLFYRDLNLFSKALQGVYRYEPGFRLSWVKVAGGLASIIGYGMARRVMHAVRPVPGCDNWRVE